MAFTHQKGRGVSEKNTWLDHVMKLIFIYLPKHSSEITLWGFFPGYSSFNYCSEYSSLHNISHFTLHFLTQLHYKLFTQHPRQKQTKLTLKSRLFVCQ